MSKVVQSSHPEPIKHYRITDEALACCHLSTMPGRYEGTEGDQVQLHSQGFTPLAQWITIRIQPAGGGEIWRKGVIKALLPNRSYKVGTSFTEIVATCVIPGNLTHRLRIRLLMTTTTSRHSFTRLTPMTSSDFRHGTGTV